MSQCAACRSSVSEHTFCSSNGGKIGYRCFSCNRTGHIDRNHSLVDNIPGYGYTLTSCPGCGESNRYTGNENVFEGIASGGMSSSFPF